MNDRNMAPNEEIAECGLSSPAVDWYGPPHRSRSPWSPSVSRLPKPPFPLRRRSSSRTLLERVPEEQQHFIMEAQVRDTDSPEWLWDEELERQGLFRGIDTCYLLALMRLTDNL
jgi:hypothetical protein